MKPFSDLLSVRFGILAVLQLVAGPIGQPTHAQVAPESTSDASVEAVTSSTATPGWQAGFDLPGLLHYVAAISIDQKGRVYAGGLLRSAGSKEVQNLTIWDGTEWSNVGGHGIEGDVLDLEVAPDGKLFIGGYQLGGHHGLVVWDESIWSWLFPETWPPSPGITRSVAITDLAWGPDATLYASGEFFVAGDPVLTHRVAKYDDGGWAVLGGPFDGQIRGLTVGSDGTVYAGGAFTKIGEFATNYMAQWNGDTWSAVGSGIGCCVEDLAADQSGNIFAGGYFESAGTKPARNVARWDGNTWHPLLNGVNDWVQSLTVDPRGNLIAGGRFTMASGNPASRVAIWNGTTWRGVGSGVDDIVDIVSVDAAGQVYAGGRFGLAGGRVAPRIAKWDGSIWSSLDSGRGVDGSIHDMVQGPNGTVFIGGNFTSAGSAVANNVAMWDGNDWAPLGSGTDHNVAALAVGSDGNLIAGGYFSQAGGHSAEYLAEWDGSSWSQLGPALNGAVEALAADGAGNLYVGGTFTQAGGGLGLNHVARWDGTRWWPLGTGLNSVVSALAVAPNGDLYAGGWFTDAAGTEVNHIARWDGSTWTPLAEGFPAFVNEIIIDSDGNLIVGGLTSEVQSWDGSSWRSLGAVSSLSVNGLALDNLGRVYAAGGTDINVLENNQWTVLASTNCDPVMSVLVRDNELLVGGCFGTIGETISHGFAVWSPVYELVAPLLFLPHDGADALSTETRLEWGQVFGADEYRVEISSSMDFAHVLLDATPEQTSVNMILPHAESSFYWRVSAIDNGLAGPWSTVRTFSTGSQGPLVSADLSPPDGTIGLPTDLSLTWSPGQSVEYSRVQIALSETFDTQVVVDRDSIEDNRIDVMGLASGQLHFWRVAGYDNAGRFTFSKPHTFTTASAALGTVSLLEPLDGAEGLSPYTTFSFVAVEGADSYHIQIGTDSAFGVLAFDVEGLPTTGYILERPLVYSNTYFWRVRAVGDGAFGPWSGIRSFTVAVGTASESAASLPTEFALHENYPNPFNPSTTIRYDLPDAAFVSLTVFDALGRQVQSLVNSHHSAGRHKIVWNAAQSPSGIYFVHMETGLFSRSQRVLLLK